MDPCWPFPFVPDGIEYGGTDSNFGSTFWGQNSYLLYKSAEKGFVTWLVKAAAKFGEHVQGVGHQPLTEIPVSFSSLAHCAHVVVLRGGVTNRAFWQINYMLKIRGQWDPKNENKFNPDSNHEDRLAHQHFYAMTTLRNIRSLLALAPRVPEECEEVTIKSTYCLPALPGEAFSTLVTNTAIRLIRANCEAQIEATAHLPGMPTEYNITEWICRGTTGEFAPDSTFQESWHNYEASWCCYEVHSAVVNHINIMNNFGYQDDLILDQRDWFTSTAPLLAVHPDYGPDRGYVVRLFISNICSFIHNLKIMGWDDKDPVLVPCLDEVTSGWMQWEHYLDPKRIPLWLTVSFQICADITLVLGQLSSIVLDDLKGHGENKTALFRKYMNHDITHRRREKDKYSLSLFLSAVHYVAKCVRQDNYTKQVVDTLQRGDSRRKSYSHELHPLLCGMQSWWLEQQYRSFESWSVKLNDSITPAALLYVSMRKLGLVDRWIDMECVLELRGVDILTHDRHRWKHYASWPDNLEVVTSFSSHFSDIRGVESIWWQSSPLSRYVADLFTDYFKQYSPRCRLRLTPGNAPSTNTLHRIVRRLYPHPNVYWRKHVMKELCLEEEEGEPVNILRVLGLVRMARYFDEILASFDWFSMHDICQKFFDSLRQAYLHKFETYEKYSPESSSDGPCSLNALYYLIFGSISDKGAENMILAGLCFNPNTMGSYELPDHKDYFFEKWGEDITRHTKELGISLESAAAVLQLLIKQEGSTVFDKSTETRRAHQQRSVPKVSAWLCGRENCDEEYDACHTQTNAEERCQFIPEAAGYDPTSSIAPQPVTTSPDLAARDLQRPYVPAPNQWVMYADYAPIETCQPDFHIGYKEKTDGNSDDELSSPTNSSNTGGSSDTGDSSSHTVGRSEGSP
ncbi:hypothetical protein E0Z10_g8396 [Xylaria hypoxylon]|uniref:Uncharacterized protein n=1 Tax=Xylaria hypoxylon TaxID=37992 RepID=A0A4Z0YP88_9PEZI|nr:hypothetical protein E0Z10_g8396 [Xylaria hypoxylon]